MTDKRLIEVAFPLREASIDSVHEKNVRHGHISMLHIWPALSANLGRPLPWIILRKALDQAFQIGVLERTLDSAAWPCDLGGCRRC